MRTKMIIAAFAIAGSMGFLGAAANADDNFDTNVVSIAYADGYMGTDHQFHVWEHRADAEAFRAKHLDRYRAWRHDDSKHAKDPQ